MANDRSPRPPVRSLLSSAPLLLIATTIALAISAGCGGKPDSATTASETQVPTPAPATTAPASDTTAAAPAAPAPGAVATDLGAQVFSKRCVLCHGPDGRGDGIASKGLNPKPRNFHDQAYMGTRTDAQLLEVIHKGKGAMPRWEGQLSEDEMKAALAHVRQLGRTP